MAAPKVTITRMYQDVSEAEYFAPIPIVSHSAVALSVSLLTPFALNYSTLIKCLPFGYFCMGCVVLYRPKLGFLSCVILLTLGNIVLNVMALKEASAMLIPITRNTDDAEIDVSYSGFVFAMASALVNIVFGTQLLVSYFQMLGCLRRRSPTWSPFRDEASPELNRSPNVF